MYFESIFDTFTQSSHHSAKRTDRMAPRSQVTQIWCLNSRPVNASQLYRMSVDWNQSESHTQSLSLMAGLMIQI